MTNYAKPRRAFFSAGVRGIGFCLCLAVILLQPTMGRSAIDDQSARAFIEGLADTAIAALTPPDVPQAEREARAKQLLRDNFAIETIGQFVLGRYWRTATADERAEYLRLFEELIVSTYVDRFKRYTGQRLKVTGSTDQPDGDVLVNSEIERAGVARRSPSAGASVTWRSVADRRRQRGRGQHGPDAALGLLLGDLQHRWHRCRSVG